MRQSTYALYQVLDNPPSCSHKYESQTKIEKGMIKGYQYYSELFPIRNKGSDGTGIKSYDWDWENSPNIFTDKVLSSAESFYAVINPLLDDFRAILKERLNVEPDAEPTYFVSATKSYARTLEKAYSTCYDANKNVTNIYDAIRDVQDYVRGAMLYTDKNLLK